MLFIVHLGRINSYYTHKHSYMQEHANAEIYTLEISCMIVMLSR